MMLILPRTFDSILPGVLPLVPEELIGPESRARVQAVASRLPAILAGSTFGFECPLETDLPDADFLVSVSGANGAALLSEAAVYARQNDSAPAWSSVAELAELWANEGRMDNVWLEFDLAGETPFVPNLFFQPVYAPCNHDELQDILSKTGTVLLGRPISEELGASLKRCVDALPERARIFQVGAMRARPWYGLRLCVDQIYLDRILFYLEQIGYPGDLDFVRKTFISLQRRTDAYALHLDLSPNVDARIGLECYLDPRPAEAHQRMRLQQLLAFLVEAGVCSKTKAFGITHFPGTADVRQRWAQWPEALRSMASFLGRLSIFQRRLHHIKITCGESKSLQAKAYLAVHHRWQ
jgi:hypothetical protein